MEKIHVMCPHCLTINAVLRDKIAQNPVCAKCQTPLLPMDPIELTESSFERFLSRTTVPILVDFWAPWCGPCKMMGPAFAQAARTLHGEILLAKVNISVQGKIGSRYAIQSVPSLLLFQQGHEITRIAGAMTESQIVVWTRQHVSRF